MYIYKTTNLINGKIYIGLSEKSPEESKGYLGSGDSIKKSIIKYGASNFSKDILEEGFSNRLELIQAEIKWINYFNSTDKKIGYNLSPGGDLNPDRMKKSIYQYSLEGNLIYIHPNIDSAKRKLDVRNSDLYKKKIRDTKPIKGFWWSTSELSLEQINIRNEKYFEELKESFKNGARKRYEVPEYKEDKKEHMRKIRLLVKNNKKNELTKNKISESIRGRKWYTEISTGNYRQMKEEPDLNLWVKGRKKL